MRIMFCVTWALGRLDACSSHVAGIRLTAPAVACVKTTPCIADGLLEREFRLRKRPVRQSHSF